MPFSNAYYTIGEICKILDAEFVCQTLEQEDITNLVIDSRKLVSVDNTLFFAIVSNRNDGHKYINELIKKGVKNFVVSSTEQISMGNSKINILKVPNTLKALQKLSTYHRTRFDLPIIGITGSNGKTIIKEWLFQLLSPDKKIVRSPKSYNSQLGVPLSVWQIQTEDELGIFEAGISEPHEMTTLTHIIRPTIGIFSNIGHAHDENFLSNSQKIGEKLNLFTHVDTLIYCSDYTEIQEVIIKSGLSKKINFFTWGKREGTLLRIEKVIKKAQKTEITGVYKNQSLSIEIPFFDDASIENAIHCWACMLYLNYAQNIVAQRMLQLATVAMRLELKEGINNCTVINDAYNSDINSLVIALDFLVQQNQHTQKTIILSDILQSGKNESSLYEEVASLLIDKKINRIIGIGKAISKQAHVFNIEKAFYPSTSDFINHFSFSSLKNEAILLKGAREFEFERIDVFLQQKSHTTRLEINLNAIAHNLNYFKNKLNPGVKLMVMVKALSYGTGSFEIANVLQFNRVDYLGVAFSDEGKHLRKTGITLPIIVLNPDENGFNDMIKYRLEPEIYNFRILNLFIEALKINKPDYTYPIHLKLDTGMHRLGFENNDIDTLSVKIKEHTNLIEVKSVFSHLAVADNANEDTFSYQQLGLFEQMSAQLKNTIGYDYLEHILNTSGIIRFPNKQYNMVRLGLGLYGVSHCPIESKVLERVSTLKTRISQIKKIKANESVGYDRKGVADTERTIATIPIGYADGLSRNLGNGIGKVKVNGFMAPIIGNICMDMCMLDITGIDAIEGDEVILLDNDYNISDMSADVGTIPYEILTGFSKRIKRVYFQE